MEETVPQILFEDRLLPQWTYSLEIAASVIADYLSDDTRNCALSFHYDLETEKQAQGYELFDRFDELRRNIHSHRQNLIREARLQFPQEDPQDVFAGWLQACDVVIGVVQTNLNLPYKWQRA